MSESNENWPECWIDAHCHLSDLRLKDRIDQVLKDARQLGVGAWIQGGVDPEDWNRQIELKKRFPHQLITSFGLHPWWIAEHDPSEIEIALQALERQLSQAQAFGELGLDYISKFKGTEEKQRTYFKRQLELWPSQLPLVLHIVRAHQDAIGILSAISKEKALKGIVHSFSGSVEDAKAYCNLGLLISVSGGITHSGHDKTKKAVRELPLDRIVVETDSPDQMPEGGERDEGTLNVPKNLLFIAEKVAELKGLHRDSVLRASNENLRKVFKDL